MMILYQTPVALAMTSLVIAESVFAASGMLPVRSFQITERSSMSPQYHVSLPYQVPNSSVGAYVEADMDLPTVKLEDIAFLRSVNCSTNSVIVIFSNGSAYEEAVSSWPSSDFILLTNHLGQCDEESKRGVFHVRSLSFEETSFTLIADTIQSSFREHVEFLSVRYNSNSPVSALKKRDWNSSTTYNDEYSGELVNTDDLKIDVYESTITATVEFSGALDYDTKTSSFTSAYMEFDLGYSGDLEVQAFAKASYSTDVWDYTIADASISAIDIDDIIKIGPNIGLSIGVEFAITGEANVTADVTVELKDGKVYLDFLQSNASYASGWTPTYTSDANLTTDVDAELNPYVELDVSIGIIILEVVDFSVGIEAKAEIINEFSADGDFTLSTSSGASVKNGTGTCSNGFWYGCDFVFDIIAYVTDLYSVTLYKVDVPIYNTECIAF